MNCSGYVKALGLAPHPEGGYFRESYRSADLIAQSALPASFNGPRNYSTAIYFLLETGDFSAFHRIKSDECWHFYAGGPLVIHVIQLDGNYYSVTLGNKLDEKQHLQFVVPANHWFASEPADGTTFSLVGCTVSPGFDFSDFEMAEATNLCKQFPGHTSLIKRLTR
jgi:uncharacterized protein